MQFHSSYKCAEKSEFDFFHGHTCIQHSNSEREREREREGERERHRQTDRQTDRDREMETKTEKGGGERERERDGGGGEKLRERETERKRVGRRETKRGDRQIKRQREADELHLPRQACTITRNTDDIARPLWSDLSFCCLSWSYCRTTTPATEPFLSSSVQPV